MGAVPVGRRTARGLPYHLLFPLLPLVEAADTTDRRHQADVRPLLDVPKEQYADHAGTQQACRGGETRNLNTNRCIKTGYHITSPQAVKRAEEHLLLVTQERSVYRQALDESRQQAQAHFLSQGKFSPPPPHAMIAPASNNITTHYSFDFAQQVHYPSNPLQPGPIYFLTPRKAAIFGVCCEAIPRQVTFVIDEASDTGKGANTVVSLLDFFFSHHGLGEAIASLHADNCSGQNKNNTMVQYLMWRVLTGLHHLHFMITGHIKFSPDACFGLIKRKFRKTDVSSLDDLAHVVEESAACNICQLVGAQDGSTIVPSRDWAKFLSSHFRRLDGIKQYQHFRFERDHPGVVFLRKTATADEEERCLLCGVWSPSPVEKPPPITPAGLSLERRRYLYDKIREYCREDVRDLVCPDPNSPAHERPDAVLSIATQATEAVNCNSLSLSPKPAFLKATTNLKIPLLLVFEHVARCLSMCMSWVHMHCVVYNYSVHVHACVKALCRLFYKDV